MPRKARKVRISNEVVNSYGFRLLTSGVDMEQYQRNPVLLYMHERGKVIGTVENIAVEGQDLVGELVFDEVTSKSKEVAAQWDKGSLRMVSAGLEIIETSDDQSLLLPGQTGPTVTQWRLMEVSVVDIGANPESLRLYDSDGNQIELSANGSLVLPVINNNNINSMNQEQIALALGLPKDATVEQIIARIAELVASSEEVVTLRAQNESITLASITASVETAIRELRLAADKKDQFIELGKKIGLDELNATLAAMQPAVKPSGYIEQGEANSQWQKLSDVPAGQLLELREKNRAEYRRLYEAEYGMKCEI